MRISTVTAILGLSAALLLLGACSGDAPANGVDIVTPAEAEALNDAAEMLDQPEPPPRLTKDNGNTSTPPVPAR